MLELFILLSISGLGFGFVGKVIFWYIKKYGLSDMKLLDARIFYLKAIGYFLYIVAGGYAIAILVIWFDYLFL